MDGILICDGDDDSNSIKIKTLSLQSYLFRFEFMNSVMVLTSKKLFFFSSKQKSSLIKEFKLSNDQEIVGVEFSQKEPSEQDFLDFFQLLADNSVEKLGFFKKEKQFGKIATHFMEVAKTKLDLVDFAANIQIFLSVKEQEDVQLVEASAKLTTVFFKKLNDEIEEVIDSGNQVKHSFISDKVDSIMDKSRKKPNKWGYKGEFYDFAYAPVIQSNSQYNLKITAENSQECLTSDCILLNICGKYYEMNCLLVRSLLVNPRESDKQNYQALLYLHKNTIKNLKTGRKLKDVFESTRNSFVKRYPNLEKHLPNIFGFGIGFEFKERCLNINATNQKEVEPNQFYAVITSLKNLRGFKSNKQYSLQLADTVVIKKDDQNMIVTEGVSKSLDEVGYDFEDEVETHENGHRSSEKENRVYSNQMEVRIKAIEKRAHEFEGKRMTRGALKRDKILRDNEIQRTRDSHQVQLLNEKMIELDVRFKKDGLVVKESLVEKIKVDELQIYNKHNFPFHLKEDEARIDSKKWAILLPVNNKVVPFHICLLKNVVRQQDSERSRIRFNFYHPGLAVPNLEFPSAETVSQGTIYLQELTYKSQQHDTVNKLAKKVKELRKKWGTREDRSISSGEKLDLGRKLGTLNDLKMRPILSGRKTKGTLHGYIRGYKFVSKKRDVFELAHANIRHAIFQPCNENMMIILHFRLKKPVQINRKRVLDVQFYCEVGAIAEDLSDPRRRQRYDNLNEMEEEEMERELQQKYNEMFLRFVETINRDAKDTVTFESPFTDFSFFGSPYYNNVLISPCERCLVSIVDAPLFVLSLEDIEIVSIERIDNKIKNFDLIIIFKNYSRPVQSISNIPKKALEQIKTWLDSKNILFFEGGKINLKWDNILKKIRENPKDFIYEDGGWRQFYDDEDDQDNQELREEDNESSFDEAEYEDEEDEYHEDGELDDLEEEEEDEEEEFSDETDPEDNEQMEDSPRKKKRSKRKR